MIKLEFGDFRVFLKVKNKPETSSFLKPFKRIHMFGIYFIWADVFN